MGGWCCDRGSIKGEGTLVSEALNAGCKTFMNASYECERIIQPVVASSWDYLDVLGITEHFKHDVIACQRAACKATWDEKNIFLIDFRKLWIFMYSQRHRSRPLKIWDIWYLETNGWMILLVKLGNILTLRVLQSFESKSASDTIISINIAHLSSIISKERVFSSHKTKLIFSRSGFSFPHISCTCKIY